MRRAVLLVLALAACSTMPAPTGSDAGSESRDGGSTADAGSDVDAGSAPSFTDTYALFATRCTACHAGTTPSGELDLSTRETAYANLVNRQVASGEMCGRTPHTLVIPGDAARSLLYQKLAGTADCGLRMPQGPEVGPNRPKPFTPDELAIVAGWIAGGAHDD